MKKLILFSLIMTVSLFAFAQKRGSDPEAKIQKKVDRMTEQLNLSTDQQAQVKTLFSTQQKNHIANGKKRSELSEAERGAMKAERKTVKEEFDKQLATILTPEQLETYKNSPKRKGKKGVRKGKGQKTTAEKLEMRVAKLTKQLNLTETQQAQMTELMLNRNKMAKVAKKERKELSKEEREDLKAEGAAYKERFESILTDEQLVTYQKLKAKQKGKGKKKQRNNKRAFKE